MSLRIDRRGASVLFSCLAVVLAAIVLPACGGCLSPAATCPTPPPPVTTPPAPAANVTATGGGTLVLHPSVDSRFAIAMDTPIRITETAGGAADWGFARLQIFNRGSEVERTELTANDIRAAGFGRIAANSNQLYHVIFRFNSSNFDRLDLTLGFSDAKDGRQFTVAVPFGTFPGVDFNLTPMSLGHSKLPL